MRMAPLAARTNRILHPNPVAFKNVVEVEVFGRGDPGHQKLLFPARQQGWLTPWRQLLSSPENERLVLADSPGLRLCA
jgi:hypothetical protein